MINMIIYKISMDGGAYFDSSDNTINLSLKKELCTKLTDNEILHSIIDSIIHEFMHYLITTEYNLNVSCLFDCIGHLFYNDCNLKAKILRFNPNASSWKHVIDTLGVKGLLVVYDISNSEYKEALEV